MTDFDKVDQDELNEWIDKAELNPDSSSALHGEEAAAEGRRRLAAVGVHSLDDIIAEYKDDEPDAKPELIEFEDLPEDVQEALKRAEQDYADGKGREWTRKTPRKSDGE